MSTVLVTGATGFIGGRIVQRLRERGDQVVAALRTPSDELGRLDVDQRLLPLTDLEGVQHAAAEAHAIVHAAATTDPTTAHEVNVDATRAVAGAALIEGLRLIHLSTTSVYDLATIGDEVVDEDAPRVVEEPHAHATFDGGSAYASTKAIAELEVERAVRNGLVGAVLRPPAVLGAGPTSTWGTQVPRRFLDGDPPAIAGDTTFGWVHVEDVVDAVLAALDADPEVIRGLVSNVVGGHVPYAAYRDAVLAFLPGDVPEPPPDPPTAWRGRYADRRLVGTLDVRPHRSFEEAMTEIADSWKDGDPDPLHRP